ncbi:B-cell receptor CD22-like [Trachinotus anak]|uniref:B-cell receptor CD22-like n=1 Tax=Trachinotus anak TaxID=443729 RepID=UPI0039F19DCD
MCQTMITVLMLLIVSEGTESSVTFENPDPCAVKGSSVEFRCSYDYGDDEAVTKTAWYKGQSINGTWKRVKLSHLPSYENRSEYLGDQKHDCSLAIHDLQVNDTGYYYFRFDTEKYGLHSKKSVHLSVTELRARVDPERVRAGDNVKLKCGVSCQISGAVWFRDGRPVAKAEFQTQAEDDGNYLCAVKGQETMQSDPVALEVQYPPLNVSVEVSYPGHLAEGGSVNLTCSNAANPAAHTYIWYSSKASSFSSMLQVGSGQVLEASHAGIYFCQARNSVGESNSTEMLLSVNQSDIWHGRVILVVGIGVKVVLVLLLPLFVIWAWRKRCNSEVGKKEEQSPDYENIICIERARAIGQNRITQKEMSG